MYIAAAQVSVETGRGSTFDSQQPFQERITTHQQTCCNQRYDEVLLEPPLTASTFVQNRLEDQASRFVRTNEKARRNSSEDDLIPQAEG